MTTDPAETPTIVTVGEGFYVRQAVDNIAWIDLGEYAIVIDALEQTGGNQTHASDLLNLTRRKLKLIMVRLGIESRG